MSQDLFGPVERAWSKFVKLYREDGPLSLEEGGGTASPHIRSEHDIAWHLARFLAEECGDPRLVNLEYPIGESRRIDVVVSESLVMKFARFGIEIKVVLDEKHPSYNPAAVSRDVEKLLDFVHKGVLSGGAVLVIDKRAGGLPIETSPASPIRVLVARDRDLVAGGR